MRKKMNEKETGINIRPMSNADVANVIALEKLISTGKNLLSDKDLLATDNRIRLHQNFIAEIGGKIAGAIIAQLEYIMIPVTEVCLINGFFVHPDYRGQGIGKKLVEAILDYCKTEDIYTIRAHVPQHDNELMRLFERMGFHRSRIINMDKTFET